MRNTDTVVSRGVYTSTDTESSNNTSCDSVNTRPSGTSTSGVSTSDEGPVGTTSGVPCATHRNEGRLLTCKTVDLSATSSGVFSNEDSTSASLSLDEVSSLCEMGPSGAACGGALAVCCADVVSVGSLGPAAQNSDNGEAHTRLRGAGK